MSTDATIFTTQIFPIEVSSSTSLEKMGDGKNWRFCMLQLMPERKKERKKERK